MGRRRACSDAAAMHSASLSSTTSVSIARLRELVAGRVIGLADDRYDDARTVFLGGIDRRPYAIVRVANAADVARAVLFARESGLELAVRSGGHSPAGHSVTDGGIVIDLRDMHGLAIDLRQRTARAETGLTAGEYTVATATCGLATGFGDTGSVGIGGITLGGGAGLLVRKHGLTIDSLLAADVVTAAGEIVRADAQNNPDLFWAIRGGGGNFGVATSFEFRLHELQQIFGGTLVLPATPDVIAGFVAEADAAPDELSTIANVMRAPPMPLLPQDRHGELVVMATLAYAGPAKAGTRAVAPFRQLAAPIADTLQRMPYPGLFPPDAEDYHPIYESRTIFADGIEAAAAEAIVEQLRASTAARAVAQLRVLGGAAARVPVDSTAYAHRDRRMMVTVAALHGRPDEAAVHREWVAELSGALETGRPGAYVNFLGDEGQARVRDAYPGRTWDRLAATKARYDPANVFRLNQNVPPAVPDESGRARRTNPVNVDTQGAGVTGAREEAAWDSR